MRAQSSIEFVILVGAVLFVLSAFLFAAQKSVQDKSNERTNLEIKEVSSIIQKEIDLAYRSSEGYRREFRLPLVIGNRDYNASIVGNVVYVITYDGKYAISLPVRNVTGQPNIGSNTIRKNEGLVYLNE